MCDERTFADMDEDVARRARLTRRELGVVAAGVGLAMALPAGAESARLESQNVVVPTPDGQADAFFVHPSEGRHPAALLWPDAFGLRPAIEEMATRLASSGYAVLAVNPYYRVGPAPIPEPGSDFANPETRKKIMSLMGALTPAVQQADAATFVDYLDARASVDTKRPIGTLGYCMGGAYTMRTAAARPDRVAAGASFHGGRLVTPDEDSPHLLVPKMKARFLFAIAENDDEQQPEAKDALRRAFDENGLAAEIEVYEGALHGWCPPDSRVYHEAQAERAWSRLLALFSAALV